MVGCRQRLAQYHVGMDTRLCNEIAAVLYPEVEDVTAQGQTEGRNPVLLDIVQQPHQLCLHHHHQVHLPHIHLQLRHHVCKSMSMVLPVLPKASTKLALMIFVNETFVDGIV